MKNREFREDKDEQKKELHPMVLIWCVMILLVCAVGLLLFFLKGRDAEREMEELRFTYVTAEPITDDSGDGNTSGGEGQTGDTDQSGTGGQEGQAGTNADDGQKVVYTTIDGVEYPDFTGMNMPAREVDIAGLQKNVNADIYAWIYIPNTKVDYPILQHGTDDEYYLKRDMNNKKASAGSIFTQHYNNKDFNDNHTVIYGHNMKNGSMFKTLHYYMEESFFESNPYIYLYLDGETRVYEIFAAYEYSDAHLLLNYDMEDSDVFGDYLEDVQSMSDSVGHFNRELELSSNDKIITLSTCIGGKPDKRYLVQAKLVAVE